MHLAKLALGLCGLIFGLSATLAADPAKARIVVIATAHDHAWNTHMYTEECKLLVKCLNQNPGVDAVFSADLDWPKDPKILEGVKSIVYYSRSAGDIVFDPKRRKETAKLFDAGVGFATIHWATATNDAKLGTDYLDLLGGWFHFNHSGLNVGKYPLVQLDPNHPVSQGWAPYPLHDEIYLNLKFHPESKPLVRVTVDGKDQIVAWVHERKNQNGGRSFGTTLGHFHDNFRIEAFRKMIVNGILWSAGLEVPKEGAKVSASVADLTLPPPPSPAK